MNANSGNYNYFSRNSKVSFDGFINENYFKIENQEKYLIQNIEITHAITKNPFTYKKDAFIGLFFKSKYDGIGSREPLSMSIALDISGSMGTVDNEDGKERITLAKESLKKLVSIMNPKEDKMSLITFNHNTLKAAMDNIKDLDDKNKKRIIMITDVDYYDNNDNLFNLFKKCVEEKNISITIIAISQNSNLSLADKISNFKGCNYFPITKSSELENFLVKQFNYIFFPIAHETKLKIESKNSTLIQCIGGGNELSDELENENDNGSKKNLSKEVSFDIGSAFPSEIIKLKDNEGNEQIYIKGGLLLLKLNYNDLDKNDLLTFNFSLEYTFLDGKKSCQKYSYTIEKTKEENYFKDNNIKKGISIYYFCIVLNHIVEVENNGDYQYLDRKKDDLKKKKDLNLLETRQAVCDYLLNNFVFEPNNDETNKNFNNYLNLIDKRYLHYKDIIYKFYNLVAAPVAY